MTKHFLSEGILKSGITQKFLCKLPFIYLEMSLHLMKLLISVTFRHAINDGN